MSRTNLVFYKGNWYHPNFFRRRVHCIKKANYTCSHCHKKQGDTCITQRGRESRVVLQAHHPNNDRTNPRAILIALCKSCHMKADGNGHMRTKKRKKREDAIRAGQLILPGFEGKKQKRHREALEISIFCKQQPSWNNFQVLAFS